MRRRASVLRIEGPDVDGYLDCSEMPMRSGSPFTSMLGDLHLHVAPFVYHVESEALERLLRSMDYRSEATYYLGTQARR